MLTLIHKVTLQFPQGSSQKFQEFSKWNLSVVLNELTKALFKPMKDRDIKHLTFKSAFLLALASGKCRSDCKVSILLRYNSLPCGTDYCSWEAAGHGQRLKKIDIYSWP